MSDFWFTSGFDFFLSGEIRAPKPDEAEVQLRLARHRCPVADGRRGSAKP